MISERGVPEPVFFYLCAAAPHKNVDPTASISPVRVHDGEWAYCPNGSSVDHDWRAIEPVTRRDLVERGEYVCRTLA